MFVFDFSFFDFRGVTCGVAIFFVERVSVDDREYKKYTVECLEGSVCSVVEESLFIEIVVDVVYKFKYENYISGFFIRDISEFV